MRWWVRQSLHTHPCTYAALVPCVRSSRRVALRAASSLSAHSWSVLVSPHTWLEVRPRSRSISCLNGWPPQIASRSCCLTSSGSRFCAQARPRARWSSACAPLHWAQWHPVCQPAFVPCAASLARVRVASPLPAPGCHASLESHSGPARQLVIVHRHTPAATGEDEHAGCDQLIADVGGWAGVPGACGDAGGLGQDVVAAIGDLGAAPRLHRPGCGVRRRTASRCREARCRVTDPRWTLAQTIEHLFEIKEGSQRNDPATMPGMFRPAEPALRNSFAQSS
jgi:hypothetical protein